MPRRLLLCLVSAVLYALALPPWSLAPLAWIALAPAFVAFQRSRPLPAAGLGLFFGVVLGATVAGWLASMLSGYFGLDRALALAGALAISAALLGVPFALFGAWAAWLTERGRGHPLIIGAGFCVIEFARANGPIANPWALSGYSQVGWSALIQSADFAGPFAIGALLGWSNALVAALMLEGPRRRLVPGFVAAAAIVTLLLGYGQWRLGQTFGRPESVSIAAVQTVSAGHSLEDHAGRDPGHASLDEQLALTAAVAEFDPDWVLWPELAMDVPIRREYEASQRLMVASAAMRADLLLGAPHVRANARGPRQRNSVYLMRDGRPVGRYDKMHLMPWGEADPLPALAGFLPSVRTRFAPGVDESPLRVRSGPVGVLLCSEALHTGHARDAARAGAEILTNPANDAWFGDPGAVAQAASAVSVRAIENRRFLVRAARDGPALVIDPHGRVIAHGRDGVSDIVVATVRPSLVETPYQRYGDTVPGLAGALVLFGTVRPARPRRGENP